MMDIRIFQINSDRDKNHQCFQSYGGKDPDGKIYDLVFAGPVDCNNLEEVYNLFNYDHPGGYRGRSLSVSDVIEVQDENSGEITYHYCDSFGFRQVSFDADKTDVSPYFLQLDPVNQIHVLLIQPDKVPQEVTIDDTLKSLQAAVGGSIEAVYPYDDPVALICNEEGKIMGLPLNRALTDDEGNVYDIVAGDFLVVGIGEESFASLPDDFIKKYTEQFLYPERFVRLSGEYIVVKELTPAAQKKAKEIDSHAELAANDNSMDRNGIENSPEPSFPSLKEELSQPPVDHGLDQSTTDQATTQDIDR